MIFPWQTDDWSRLQQLREHWPHALLLHGQAGIGKLRFAQHLAQGLLCEARQANGEPCGACVACTWFTQGNHPDYRIVVPEALAAEAGVSGSADEKAEKADGDEGKKTRAPSKEIKIEQIRGLLDRLRASVQALDLESTHGALHLLLGASGNIGAHALHQYARQIYPRIVEGDWPADPGWVNSLYALGARSADALQAYYVAATVRHDHRDLLND
jgi:DNA polymerase III delta prime subunit